MHVAMPDHIARRFQKRILRGRMGYVHSWVLAAENNSRFHNGKRVLTRLPKVVNVKCYDQHGKDMNWTLPGMSEPGVYPIVHVKR